ncbi:cellulose biosynthesis protein BcsN [Lichenibacterium dinghuense]|uniref:cellulose biosynthesis protein BcsN n=1 Tax=Lichenibacterium dinghuense TaxID=2895977 RepID=UPI001F3710DD|nr:cellulose biosynthesis protein BcsN [Lichenibacterium sp. 6Y81]
MSLPRLAPLLASALCLSACAAGSPGPAVGRYPAAGREEAPLASLPAAAGRVVAVRRIPYSNGFGQEIVLDGPRAMSGENRITVEALTSARTGLAGQGAEELKLGPPTDVEIAAEMERALPGVAMHLAPAPERGEDGPIGYAAGAAGRLSCVYAWQYLAPARPLSLFEGAAGTGALPVSVRVRLCREGPAAALVEALRGLRAWRPDGSEPVALRSPAGGDALTEAVGSLPPAPAVEPAPAAAPSVAAPRRRRHRLAAVSRRAVAHLSRTSRRRVPDGSDGLAGVPPLPMPGDIPAAPRPAAPAPRAAAADLGGMPMPR